MGHHEIFSRFGIRLVAALLCDVLGVAFEVRLGDAGVAEVPLASVSIGAEHSSFLLVER